MNHLSRNGQPIATCSKKAIYRLLEQIKTAALSEGHHVSYIGSKDATWLIVGNNTYEVR